METAIKEISNKRSDWCKVLSIYSDQQSICTKCALQKNTLQSFILPTKLAKKKLEGINLKAFAKKLISVNKPLIFKGEKESLNTSFLIHYNGQEDYQTVLAALEDAIEPVLKPKALVLSPNHIKKSDKLAEAHAVKVLQSFFDPTSFIKLPVEDLTDLIALAKQNNVEMLLLPQSMLAPYLSLLLQLNNKEILPAAFTPHT